MNLVQYSDSEASDEEAMPQLKPESQKPTAPAPPSKPAFQKVVDRSNPHKIRVNLPITAAASTTADEIEQEAPPAKRARTGGGAFSGFNSFLPAPKKTGPAGGSGAGSAQKGLGRGINLKTGAAPAFSREVVAETGTEMGVDEGADAVSEETPVEQPANGGDTAGAEHQEEVRLVGKTTVFKPLSVARNTRKKKKPALPPAAPTVTASKAATMKATAPEPKAPPKPKVSLFSMPQEEPNHAPATTNGQYTPMVYEPEQPPAPTETADATPDPNTTYIEPTQQPTGPQSLTAIASDLHLSASARRQLFGRAGKSTDPSSSTAANINIITFNTDAEYAANEALRAAGETVQHNPVRAIAPGKHSLKQLVNAASTQKEALEESWASGKGRRKEAGGRYGW